MQKKLINSFIMLLIFTAITGVAYPFSVYLITHHFFPYQSHGSLVSTSTNTDMPLDTSSKNTVLIRGSMLIGQRFYSSKYFWGRPSLVNYQAQNSGGSNLSPTDTRQFSAIAQRKTLLIQNNPHTFLPDQTNFPAPDLLLASASGLDPQISKEAALYQLDRVSAARQLLLNKKVELRSLILENKSKINLLLLNLQLDEFTSR
ncbi:MAG: potassium-transporting ATPase subunit C [Oligoflexia bacterium]|nr:potassium-transporting ATPase subunit C [Oligoflexia bacterium]